MSSVSEQDHLNPRDPLYYAPRWLRERSASFRDADPGTSLAPSPVNYDSRLENAVSDALRHPLDPEVMREPEQAAHAIGKLILHCGENNVLWGTDSIWYGSPQDQIQAFRAFQIAEPLIEKYGYPRMTPALRAKVFGRFKPRTAVAAEVPA